MYVTHGYDPAAWTWSAICLMYGARSIFYLHTPPPIEDLGGIEVGRGGGGQSLKVVSEVADVSAPLIF